jgi:purine-nucleoside phosphorylase
MEDPYVLAQEAADALKAKLGGADLHAAIVLGSGWGPAVDRIGETVAEVPFTEIPGFPPTTVLGHKGVFRSVQAGDRRILVMAGRVHLYEGHPPAKVVHGVRSMVLAGAKIVVLTNACGGLRPGMAPGEPVLIRDHINFTGVSPLTGPNPEALGPRFVDLTGCYAPRLRRAAQALDPALTEGVYVGFPGPMFETPAEIEMVGRWGGDMVGMSTVLEAIAARHLGAEVLGLALVTNLAAGLPGANFDHEEILEVARATAERMGGLFHDLVRTI